MFVASTIIQIAHTYWLSYPTSQQVVDHSPFTLGNINQTSAWECTDLDSLKARGGSTD